MSPRFKDVQSIEQLRDDQIPETVALEYKQQIDIGTKPQNLETLKDLSGIGNGGGGTIIYGIVESSSGVPYPVAFKPLTDRTLLGRLENIVRSTVRPPLLVEYEMIEMAGGYLLTVDVQQSPLGPYMVEAYNDRRYYLRIGTTTAPMGEQQVRDAYLMAARARDHRPELWTKHALPLGAPTRGVAWLVVSALPEEPLAEMLDLRHVNAQDLQGPDSFYVKHAFTVGVPALARLTRWVDGFFADVENAPGTLSRRLRIYRDGAFGAAVQATFEDFLIDPVYVARLLDGILIYLAWLWDTFGLRRPTELRFELHNAGNYALDMGPQRHQAVTPLPGVGLPAIATEEYQLPSELGRASVRHSVVMRFADRLHQAVGEQMATKLFRGGQLYGQDGAALNMSIQGGTITAGMNQPGWLYDSGIITSTTSGKVVAAFDQGVIFDMAGDTLAVTEMAPGPGCPDSFQATLPQPDVPVWSTAANSQPLSGIAIPKPSNPTGKWSDQSLGELLR